MQNQESKPEGRFFLAMAMTFGFLFVWYNYLAPKPASAIKENVSSQQDTSVEDKNTSLRQKQEVTNKVDTAKQMPEQDKSLVNIATKPTAQQSIKPEQKTVETNSFALSFSNQGGGLFKVVSKEHMKVKGGEEGVVLLAATKHHALPLSWLFDINGQIIDTGNMPFKMVYNESEKTVEFNQQLAADLSLSKTFSWQEESHLIGHAIKINNTGSKPYTIKPIIELAAQEAVQTEKKRSFFFAPQLNQLSGLADIGDDVSRWPVSKFGTDEKPTKIPTGGIEWFGFDQQYFLFSALPKEGRWESLKVEKAIGENEGVISAQYPSWSLAAGQQKSYAIDIYAGPKDIHVLEQTKPGLEQAIDLGSWLGPIARPILRFLKFLHDFVPNYGVAIILLTVLVRLLMFPLTQVQAKSMKKMSLHKPQMDALKEQYKDDREAYSRELMGYMREHKINPASGCFLLILQMPVFFALYRVLYNSIELRHAPFFGWINDLSAHDPLFILPVLLGISMFFQQKLTPTAGVDPAQQQIMKFIPLIFTVFMIFLPAGLNLYILVSTLWGVGQQYWIQKGTKAVTA
ncbi:MAG TPA: membrane protein insertase YidC [Oligoflexia bacterium]|nr:membrane protein insertase YidC [Oligoflexia bacterium]HMR25040.1 membrane protein insertase YidC [Oligoflexia bacterium]